MSFLDEIKAGKQLKKVPDHLKNDRSEFSSSKVKATTATAADPGKAGGPGSAVSKPPAAGGPVDIAAALNNMFSGGGPPRLKPTNQRSVDAAQPPKPTNQTSVDMPQPPKTTKAAAPPPPPPPPPPDNPPPKPGFPVSNGTPLRPLPCPPITNHHRVSSASVHVSSGGPAPPPPPPAPPTKASGRAQRMRLDEGERAAVSGPKLIHINSMGESGGPPRHPPPPLPPASVTSTAQLVAQFEQRFQFLSDAQLPAPPPEYKGPRTYRANRHPNRRPPPKAPTGNY